MEAISLFIHKWFKKDPNLITKVEELYTELLKTLVIGDIYGKHEAVEALIQDLFIYKVPDAHKSKFIVSLVNQFLVQPFETCNIKNFISFLYKPIQANSIKIALNDLFKEFMHIFECDHQGIKEINGKDHVMQIMATAQSKCPPNFK